VRQDSFILRTRKIEKKEQIGSERVKMPHAKTPGSVKNTGGFANFAKLCVK
jgi:hypothetical protein